MMLHNKSDDGIFGYEYFTEIELELTGTCNLECPLCIRNIKQFSLAVEKNILPLSEWISIIDKFTNLKKVILMGSMSEPTLYPYFIELCKELKSRKLQIVISTNGCTRDHTFWDSLSKILDNHDSVIFSVDGISQQEYSTYRINGNLNTLLKNHKSFKNKNKNDYMQFIKFDYNINTIDTPEYKDFVKQFSNNYEIDTECVLNYNFINEISMEIHPPEDRKIFLSKANNIINSRQNCLNVEPECLIDKKLFINNFGNFFGCCAHARSSALSIEVDGKLDFNDVITNKLNSCIKCDKMVRKFVDLNKGDYVY